MQIEFYKYSNEYLYQKILLFFVFTLFSFTAADVWALNVSGPCNTCHTMHNSQDGTAQVSVLDGAAWDLQSNGSITGGSSSAAQEELLISDCVGCHSMADNATITVNDGYNTVPIVYNTGGHPVNAPTLAGGNFGDMPGNETFGHNVRGISPLKDSWHNKAPGMQDGVGCSNSCHTDLTLTDAATNPTPGGIKTNGCRGCHLSLSHHKDTTSTYRGLGAHGGVLKDVGGVEDPDWEATTAANDHNVYLFDDPTDGVALDPNMSIGRWCAGCHNNFHAWGTGDPMFGDPNAGHTTQNAGTNPWLRHPTNVIFPIDGEYAVLTGTAYNPKIPVAQQSLPASHPLSAQVNIGNSGDQVFCLSCHRAHASDQPDALRFDYAAIQSHGGTADLDPDGDGFSNGCFYCHTSKANL